MSSRAVLGDFLDAAHEQFSSSASRREAPQGGGDIQQVSDSLLRVLILMSRYVQDVTAGSGTVPARGRRVLTVWGRAGAETREALSNAAASLHEPGARRWLGVSLQRARPAPRHGGGVPRRGPGSPAYPPRARSGRRTGTALRVGTRRHVAGATRAVLAEIGLLARQIAPLGARFALAPGSHGAPWARRKLNAACQWLWVLNTRVEAAQREDPVRAADMELLCAIPVNAAAPRRLPGVSEPVARLCEGVISTAERVRHAEWEAGQQPPWSPGLTADSLRLVALTSAVTSHNCQTLLRCLAARVDDRGSLRDRLLRAAEAAGHAREGWVRVAHALDRVTTDTRRVRLAICCRVW
ncbi:MAG TPA: hypothetical protein VMV92_43880 [Streptosporangiaceae bacterium]|nr:hypothetical protein [Streptosporangiaceae bacterium]